jgi:small subunit ribosomal protein S17
MKILIGKVISKKMEKTAIVEVERIVAHKLYKKRYKRTKKYFVHDELETIVGQQVKFSASRPYSKLKKWKVIEVIDRQNSKGNERQALTKKLKAKRVATKVKKEGRSSGK